MSTKKEKRTKKLKIINEEINDIQEQNNEINIDTFDNEMLKNDYDNLKSHDSNDKDYNKFLLKKELVEHNYLKQHEKEYDFLYPDLNDPEFNIKIAEKKEFNDTKYDGEIDPKLSVEEQADILSKADF